MYQESDQEQPQKKQTGVKGTPTFVRQTVETDVYMAKAKERQGGKEKESRDIMNAEAHLETVMAENKANQKEQNAKSPQNAAETSPQAQSPRRGALTENRELSSSQSTRWRRSSQQKRFSSSRRHQTQVTKANHISPTQVQISAMDALCATRSSTGPSSPKV